MRDNGDKIPALFILPKLFCSKMKLLVGASKSKLKLTIFVAWIQSNASLLTGNIFFANKMIEYQGIQYRKYMSVITGGTSTISLGRS